MAEGRKYVASLEKVLGPTFGMSTTETREWALRGGLAEANPRSHVVRRRAAETKANYLASALGEDWQAVSLAWNTGLESAWRMMAQGLTLDEYLAKYPEANAAMAGVDWGQVQSGMANQPNMGQAPNTWEASPGIAGAATKAGGMPQQVYDYLTNVHGLSSSAALGVLVNVHAESNFNSSAVGDSGSSFGMFQHHKGRADNMKAYAASRGKHWTDWQVQVDFAMREAAGYSGWDPGWDNAEEAAKWWTIYWERPANAQEKSVQRAGLLPQYEFLRNTGPQAFGMQTLVDPETGFLVPDTGRDIPIQPVNPAGTTFDPNSGPTTVDPNPALGMYSQAAAASTGEKETAVPGAGATVSKVLSQLSAIARQGGTPTEMNVAGATDTARDDVQVQ